MLSPESKTVFATVITRSFLPYLQVLRESLNESGHREPLAALIVDSRTDEGIAADMDNIELVFPDQCQIPEFGDMCVYFDPFELCNALKPFFIRHLMDHRDRLSTVIYTDSDLFFCGNLTPVLRECEAYTVTLTPHHLEPPDLELTYTPETAIVDMGLLNGGFAVWNRRGRYREILDWMITRFPVYGFAERTKAMFVDQKLLPLLLTYFPEEVQISRDPTLNIAFWNAHEREVGETDSRYVVGSSPVKFFHFSGFRPTRPDAPCSYLPDSQNRQILERSPWMQSILSTYFDRLVKHGANRIDSHYGFSNYRGIRLTRRLREFYFRNRNLNKFHAPVLRLIFLEWLRSVKQWLFPYRPQ